MGFFRKKAKEQQVAEAEERILETGKVEEKAAPSEEELAIVRLRKDLEGVTSELDQKRREIASLDELVSTKQELRKSIEEKLADVQKEYDTAVGSLMSTKKELNDARRQRQSATSELDNVQKRLTDIIADTSSAESIRKKKDEELRAIEKKHGHVKAQIAEMERAKSLLEEVKGEITADQAKNSRLKSQIVESEKTLARIENEKKTALEAVRKAEKTLEAPRVQSFPAKKNTAEEKSVVEAASAVVASMKKKVRSAESELALVKGLLEKERRAHEATREKLARYNEKG